ncbi:MAG: F0F1 ATP synthase subunit B [Candidatus Pacebacteria bacterium]|nr:F0F1 ATP synthase subunit B [Candidatus Paceibacterota bacterium]MCF7863124.1 F0F1 ATP synthase subunit B [Candidatus Paceibacterota bacterium]
MESIIETFHIDWKLIVAQIFNFAVVLTVLYFYALKPLQKLMAERSEKIEKGLKDAKICEENLAKTTKEYEETLAKARAEANDFIKESKKEANDKKNEMLEEAKNEVKILIDNGKKTLEAEKEKMIAEAKKEVSLVAVKMAERLLAGKMDSSFDQRSIEDLKNIK